MTNIYMTRDDLYKMVWTEPISKIAETYGWYDKALTKICNELEIPVPGRGFWQKKKKGLNIPIPPLPLQRISNKRGVSFTIDEKLHLNDVRYAEMQQMILYEELEENKIIVKPILTFPHTLIETTVESLKKATPDDKGRLIVRKKNCLDVNIGPDSIDRAMRIMDALLKALEKRGLNVFVEKLEPYKSYVIISGEKIEFRMSEWLRKTEKQLTKMQIEEKKKYPWIYTTKPFDFSPSGKLYLEIINGGYEWRKRWSDVPNHKLEDRLNSFVIGMIKTAEAIVIRRYQAENDERIRQERMQREQEKERIRQQEEARFQTLNRDASSWHQSQQIRSYLEAVKTALTRQGNEIVIGSELDKWLKWAFQQADRLDPLQGIEMLSTWLKNRWVVKQQV